MIDPNLTPTNLNFAANYQPFKIYYKQNVIEKSFKSNLLAFELKQLLEPMIGLRSNSMVLKSNGAVVSDEDLIAGYKSFEVSGREIEFEYVEKLEMADEEYDKRTDTVRDFKRRNQLGRFKPTTEQEVTPVEKCGYTIGSRCEIKLNQNRGVIAYVGELPGKKGEFVGIRLDEPVGKNNGSFENIKYFECGNNHGVFVRPSQVSVGDYPEIDIFEDF
jgi:tubulin-folding cofactor B